jgi:DNA-binding MarR family transcriptional regulator
MSEQDPFDQVIAVMTAAFANLESQALQEANLADLSMKQMVYLNAIASMENPTASDLAKRLKVTRPSVTAIITRLIHKGYILRVQSGDDKRAYILRITEKGQALNEAHNNLHRKIAKYFSQALSHDELETLAALMKKVISENPS